MEPTEPPSAASLAEARRAIEAIVLVATDPAPTQQLAQLVELPVDLVDLLCRELARAYEAAGAGFQLVEVGGGWRYQTHPDCAPYVERFALDGQSTRMSSAALETLAIVAYKQPISRAQVSAIRGVNVDGVLRTLVQRGYVEEVGRDSGAGQAVLFGTTQYFLERVGLNALDQLPALGDFVPSAEVVEALEHTLRVDPAPRSRLGDHDDTDAGGTDAARPDAGPLDTDGIDAGPFGDGSVDTDGIDAGPFGDGSGTVGIDAPDAEPEVVIDLRDPVDPLDAMAVHPAGTGDEPVVAGDSVIDLRDVGSGDEPVGGDRFEAEVTGDSPNGDDPASGRG